MKEIEKPVIGKRTQIGKAFDQFLKESKLPIHEWANNKVKSKKL